PALAVAEHVQADVGRDPVEPRAKRRPPLEAVERAPRPHHRLLHRVLGLERGSEHAIAVSGELATVLLEQRLELFSGLSAAGCDFDMHGSYPRPGVAASPLPACR